MKNISIAFAFALGFFACVVLINNYSCTREDAVIGTIEPPFYEYGSGVIKTSAGWNFDKAHSNVEWESAYRGVGAPLTGRFNSFGAILEFDEQHPESSSLSGYVLLTSVNTGEPGRDGGCLQTTFESAVADTARLTSKSFAYDGVGGFNITADLEFHGVTKEVIGKGTYAGATHIDASSPYTLSGFSFKFEFNALTDFLIDSGNIADRVVVNINSTYRLPD